jgi:uncharacterized protein YneF (UPF0154 family)
MGIVVLIIGLAIVISVGIIWGRYTIQKDTMRKAHDEEELEKLHQLHNR